MEGGETREAGGGTGRIARVWEKGSTELRGGGGHGER